MRAGSTLFALALIGVSVPALAGLEAGRTAHPSLQSHVVASAGLAQPSSPSPPTPQLNSPMPAGAAPILDPLPFRDPADTAPSDNLPPPDTGSAPIAVEHVSPWEGTPIRVAAPLKQMERLDPYDGTPITRVATPRMTVDRSDPWAPTTSTSL